MITIAITKTSKEAKCNKEAWNRDKEKKRKSRYCPECGKFQLFRNILYKELLGTRAKLHIGYTYKCKCGCEWECYRVGSGKY